MNSAVHAPILTTRYDRSDCQIGVVHLGFGAFHRAHQAVFLDDYMESSRDLQWGIEAVNLRGSEALAFKDTCDDIERNDGYFLKSYSADGQVGLRRVRSHLQFSDWSVSPDVAEAALSRPTVHLVTITVTEGGYYTDPNGRLNLLDPTIRSEIAGGAPESVYGYLRAAMAKRIVNTGAPLTIACCDNIRQNGKMLHRNLVAYLKACGDLDQAAWVKENVAFPCSMVDRITPRSPESLGAEISALVGHGVTSPIMAEDFIQWVLENKSASEMPDLAKAGVTVTGDVDPYEETKIRVLNGGHTAVAYLAALEGVETFDTAMRVPHLMKHFENFESKEVLPALTLILPFSKEDYLSDITRRFGNSAIGDTVARICADGMAKFPIFIRPTLEGCLDQGIMPTYAIRSIAGWYVFVRKVEAGKIPFEYVEPSWDALKAILDSGTFVTSRQLWGDIPQNHPYFAETLQQAITELEMEYPL